MKGSADKSVDHVQPVLDKVAAVQAAHKDFTVAEFGFASATKELNDTIGNDFQKAEKLSVPITFLILLFAFGAFVAAGIPVLLAFTAVLGVARPVAGREPRVPRVRRDAVRDAPDGHGGRRRLLALLLEARARGARRGP